MYIEIMYSYERTVEKNAETIFGELHKALKEKDWLILSYVDVKEIFKKMNKELEPYYILDVCYPKAAIELITADPDIGAFIPCKLVLMENGNKTRILMPKPSVQAKDYLNLNGEIVRKYEDALIGIINEL